MRSIWIRYAGLSQIWHMLLMALTNQEWLWVCTQKVEQDQSTAGLHNDSGLPFRQEKS